MKREVGQATCPECGETETVMHDGRKYYIKCSSCGALINYQSNAAKARIEAKLKPVAEKPTEPESPEPVQPEKPETSEHQEGQPKKTKPYKPARATDKGLLGSYDDWF